MLRYLAASIMAELPAIWLMERTIGYVPLSSLIESKAMAMIFLLTNCCIMPAFRKGR
ncbi:hypothetical protein D3C74_503410 [compost metagenome]